MFDQLSQSGHGITVFVNGELFGAVMRRDGYFAAAMANKTFTNRLSQTLPRVISDAKAPVRKLRCHAGDVELGREPADDQVLQSICLQFITGGIADWLFNLGSTYGV